MLSAVSGFGSEAQIIEALNRYLSRPQYIQKTLYYLFKMTTGNHEPRIEMSNPRIDIIYVSPAQLTVDDVNAQIFVEGVCK